MLNQLSVSSSRIPGATFSPQQANSNDVLRHSAMLNQSSAPGSRIAAMTFPPQQTDLNAVLRDAPMLNQLSASSSRIPGATFAPPNSNDVLSHSAMLNQSSAPGSRIPTMTFPPQQTDSNAVNNFPVRHARTFSQEAAFNPGAPALANDPRNNSTVAPAFAPLFLGKPGSGQMAPHKLMQDTVPQELEQCNYGTPVTGVLLPHQPGPEKFTPQMLVQNREVLPSANIEGTKPASEVYQLDPVILRLNVASFIPQDGTEGGAGVLIRNNNTAEFIGATNFRIQSTEPARTFAATCYEAIKIAETHQPITIILESHLFPLLDWFCTNQIPWPEIEELKALLKPPRCVVRNILEESNGAACHLAIHAMLTSTPRQFFTDPPGWLLPYLSGC
ncbi:hypothetical protein BRADI_4g16063v3 [Brachypodium distachyon]|nr:hypothetical protein BRADI_4g16063v3 [Brachypodium distachyon]